MDKDQGRSAPKYEASLPESKAKAIRNAKTYEETVTAVQDVLSLAGLATVGPKGEIVQAALPAAPLTVQSAEMANLALELRNFANAGRMTLSEFAEALEEFGFPFATGRKTEPEQLQAFLSAWIKDAGGRKDDPTSFVPLFLAELARSRQPSIDLAAATYKPEQYRLSLLEMQLFTSVFDRALSSKKTPEAAGFYRTANIAYAAEPCSDVKKWLGDSLGDKGKVLGEELQIILGEGTGFGLKKALESALGELGAEQMGKMISSVGIASKLLKLATLYSHVQLKVDVESENPLKKHLSSEEPKFTAFKASAGVSEKDWKDYQEDLSSADIVRSLRDCMGVAGLPVRSDIGDLGKDSANWTVEWRLVEGSPAHGLISLDNNKFLLKGQLEMQLQQENDHMASATLVVDLTPDKSKDRSGPERTAPLTAEASLDTSAAPGLGTLVSAVKGGFGDVFGITDAIVDLAAGFIQTVGTPKAYGTLTVKYHEQPKGNWTGKIVYTQTSTENSESKIGYRRGESTYRAEITILGTEKRTTTALDDIHYLFGKASATLTRESESYARAPMGNNGCYEILQNRHNENGRANDSPISGATLHLSVATNSNNRYSVSVTAPGMDVEIKRQYKTNYEKCGPTWIPRESNDTDSIKISRIPVEGISGQFDPSKPYQLQGSKTTRDPDGGGGETTVSWSLEWKPD